MTITEATISSNSIDTSTKVGIAILDKTIENNEEMGNSMIDMMQKSMMENSVYTNLGDSLDIYV